MIEQKEVVLCNSLSEFVYRIDEMRQNGWEFDPEMPPVVYGFSYEAGFMRAISDKQHAEEVAELNKPTRADILAKARAAKAAKKEATNV